jgi:hypothetical protein
VVDQRRTGRPGADHDLQHVGGQHAVHRGDGAAHRQRRQLRRLDHDRVAGEQRRDGVAQRQVEGRVPGADDPHDAAGLEEDAAAFAEQRARADARRPEPARGAAHEIPALDADAHQFADHVDSGLAGLALEAIEHGRAVADQLAAGGAHELDARAGAQRTPRLLRRTRPLHRGCDGAGVVDRQFLHDRPACGVAHGESVVPVRGQGFGSGRHRHLRAGS